MKRKMILIWSLTALLLTACSSDDRNPNNPYLISPIVNLQLNLNLPEYNPLNFPGNSIIITSQGIRGIVIYNIDNSQYAAFELSDPNHVPNDCSRMDVEGIEATCLCEDGNRYNIVTGQHFTQPDMYPMQRYRANREGSILFITN
jgi:hypothetical protein